jgi:hypothetical protein
MENMQKELVRTDKKEIKAPLKAQIQEILALITAFTNLLVKETEALKKADFKTVDTLQAEKKLFAKQYEAKVSALADRREELPGMELALREKLMKERMRFNKVLDENMHALDLAQNSTKRLVNRILEAAREAVVEEKQTNYSSGGKAMAYKSASLSITLDQTL